MKEHLMLQRDIKLGTGLFMGPVPIHFAQSKPFKFEGIKIKIIKCFPQTEKLYSISVSHHMT